jgi:hypothetical protein
MGFFSSLKRRFRKIGRGIKKAFTDPTGYKAMVRGAKRVVNVGRNVAHKATNLVRMGIHKGKKLVGRIKKVPILGQVYDKIAKSEIGKRIGSAVNTAERITHKVDGVADGVGKLMKGDLHGAQNIYDSI